MLKKAVIPVPKNLTEAAQFLAKIGKEQMGINEIQLKINAQVEQLKAKAMDDVKPRQDKISQLVEGLFAYAEANRKELTDGDKRKTIKLPTGDFMWRMTPPAVSLRNVKAILANLKLLGLKRFIRVKEEVDKKAMLKELKVAKKIKGVSITQREEFVIKPAEIEIEIATPIDKLKKVAT